MPEPLNGRRCPVDQTVLLPQEDIVSCSVCNTLHHARCWRENKICTTLDCRGKPVPVVVALESTADIKHLNTQLDDLRTTLHRITRKLDKVIDAEGEAASKAIAELSRRIDAALKSEKDQAQRVVAALTEVLLRVRSLDYTVARHRFPPEGAFDRLAAASVNGEGRTS